jgi:hypothetical protein
VLHREASFKSGSPVSPLYSVRTLSPDTHRKVLSMGIRSDLVLDTRAGHYRRTPHGKLGITKGEGPYLGLLEALEDGLGHYHIPPKLTCKVLMPMAVTRSHRVTTARDSFPAGLLAYLGLLEALEHGLEHLRPQSTVI